MRLLLLTGLFFVALCASAEPNPNEVLRTFRASEGLQQPVFDDKIALACRQRARMLLAAGSLTHTDREGREPGLQMLRLGFPVGEYGEVLGAGANFGDVWRAWLRSPTHWAVLRAPLWKSWGWGSAASGRRIVWVLRFWSD